MIINTGGRTDTVQYYSDWLLNRFSQGYVLSRNPMFPSTVNRYELDPEVVDCVVFCSKNYRPILPRLHEITERFNTYFHYTITAYGTDMEPRVPHIDESMDTLVELSQLVGKQRIAWRYDPVLLSDKYSVELHCETFARMAKRLAPYVDRCIFSFVQLYKKLEYNMPELKPVGETERMTLAHSFGQTAQACGMTLQTCATAEDYSLFGIQSSGCMTLDILGRANGIQFRPRKHPGMRPKCHCIDARDIGAYNTCPNGCRYCYANRDPQQAERNYHLHDPNSPLLLGHLQPSDTILPSPQKSWLSPPPQPTLFDFPDMTKQ